MKLLILKFFSIPMLFPPSQTQIFPSAPYSQTPSAFNETDQVSTPIQNNRQNL
jgi:hypothetical protein